MPPQVDSSSLVPNPKMLKLNSNFSKGIFNLEGLCNCDFLLAYWGIHPDSQLAYNLDLGDYQILYQRFL